MGDDGTRARALILVGMAQLFSDPAEADPVLTEAAACAAAAGDDWGRAEALQTLAYAHLARSDHAAALRCADAARPAVDRLGHGQLRAWDAAIRAEVAGQTGRPVDACRHGRDALVLATGIGEPVSANGGLLPLVRALCQRGRVEDAAAVVAGHRPFLDSHPGLGTTEALALTDAIVAVCTDPAAAAGQVEEAVAALTAAGMTWFAAEAAMLLAVARFAGQDPTGALAAAADAIAGAEAVGSRDIACQATLVRCAVDRALGHDPSDAVHRTLVVATGSGLRALVPDALDLVAGAALDAGRPGVTARLHAAADRARAELGLAVSPLARLFRGPDGASAATALGPGTSAARDEGARLGLEQAVAYATRTRGRRGRPRSGWDSLTPTERDVVVLAARGLSNQAIGSELLSSAGTVRTHLRSVFGKLGVSSRTELAAEAVRRGL